MVVLLVSLLLAQSPDPVRDLVERMGSDAPDERHRAFTQLRALG